MLDQHEAQAAKAAADLVPAAQYIRMSTEHQQYSTRNQAHAIAAYAECRGFEVVLTYADEGKSGLTIANRPGLRQLLNDVAAGARFKAVLVYDISRWGRFQDSDESAYYEFLCRQMGIPVHYCAEPFENDGSISSALLKSVKRVMAAEYSRDLSAKVFAGQSRMVMRGFRVSGACPLGYQRQLIDRNGRPRCLLEKGERKGIQTDRVILVPGPPEQIALVRRMFRMYANERLGDRAIERLFNAEGIRTRDGKAWHRDSIRSILRNEVYIGTNIYARRSKRLTRYAKPTSPETWVRAENAFEAIIPRAQFERAQQLRRHRARHLTDDQLINMLADILKRHGKLTKALIDQDSVAQSSQTYLKRFGSMRRAYGLAGYDTWREHPKQTFVDGKRRLRFEVMTEIYAELCARGLPTTWNFKTHLLTVGADLTVSVLTLRHRLAGWGAPDWSLYRHPERQADLTVVVQADATGERATAFYLLHEVSPGLTRLRPYATDEVPALAGSRIDSLERFYEIAAASFYGASEPVM